MKKAIIVFLCLAILFSLCGCKTKKVTTSSTQNKTFSQSMTIVTMPSPPKCKITTNITTINKVLDILGQVEKEEIVSKSKGGWYYMIKLNVDGTVLSYTIGGNLFTDLDGRQYQISNGKEIEEMLKQIYDEIDIAEAYYP